MRAVSEVQRRGSLPGGGQRLCARLRAIPPLPRPGQLPDGIWRLTELSFQGKGCEGPGSTTSAALAAFPPPSLCFSRSKNAVEWAHFCVTVFLEIGQRIFLMSYEFCCLCKLMVSEMLCAASGGL